VSLSLKQAGAKGDAVRAASKAAEVRAEADVKKRQEKRKGKALKGGLEF